MRLLLAIVCLCFCVVLASDTIRTDADLRAALMHAYTEGSTRYTQGDFVGAIRLFRKVVRLAPSLEEGYLNLGVAMEGARKYRKAEALYRKAMAKFPKSVAAVNHLCTTLIHSYHKRGERRAVAEAQDVCVQAVQRDSTNIKARENMGTLMTHLFRFEEAIGHLLFARRAKPDDPLLTHNLAQAYIRSNQPKLAIQVAKEAITKWPQQAAAYCNLGTIYQWVKRYDRVTEKTLYACLRRHLAATGSKRSLVTEWKPWASQVQVQELSDERNTVYGCIRPQLYPPNETYVPLRLRYNEKRIVAVSLSDVWMEGQSGILYNSDSVFTGSHQYNSKLQTEYTGDTSPVTRSFEDAGDSAIYLSLVTQNLANYYHWVAEGLSRFVLARKLLLPRLKITHPNRVVMIVVPDYPHIRASLHLLQWPLQHIVWYRGAADRFFFERLFVIDWEQTQKEDIYQTNSWDNYSGPRAGYNLIRSVVTKAALADADAQRTVDALLARKSFPLVIFVSRRDAGVRKMNNEQVMTASLASLLGEEHLFIVEGARYPFQVQALLFHRADIVVGGHGAGFVNTIFCRKNTSVVLFPLQPNVDNSFSHLAMAQTLDLWIVPSVSAYYFGMFQVTHDAAHHVLDLVTFLVHSLLASSSLPTPHQSLPPSSIIQEEL